MSSQVVGSSNRRATMSFEELDQLINEVLVPKDVPVEPEVVAQPPSDPDAKTVDEVRHHAVSELNKLNLGHAVVELLVLPASRTIGSYEALALRKHEAVRGVIQASGLWRPDFVTMKPKYANGMNTEFASLGAGIVGDTGVVVMHKRVSVKRQPEAGHTHQYLGFRADATYDEIMEDGADFKMMKLTAENAAIMQVAAYEQEIIPIEVTTGD